MLPPSFVQAQPVIALIEVYRSRVALWQPWLFVDRCVTGNRDDELRSSE